MGSGAMCRVTADQATGNAQRVRAKTSLSCRYRRRLARLPMPRSARRLHQVTVVTGGHRDDGHHRVRWPPRGTPCCHRPPRGGSSWPPPIGSRPATAPGTWPGRSPTARPRCWPCLGEGLSNAQIAARLYLSEARVKGYVSRMLDKLGCANRVQAGLLAHDAPVSSARSPGRRSCRLELGLGARQAGLRPSPGRSCPPGAAGLTSPPRVGGCCDHVVDAVGGELLQDQRMHGVLLG